MSESIEDVMAEYFSVKDDIARVEAGKKVLQTLEAEIEERLMHMLNDLGLVKATTKLGSVEVKIASSYRVSDREAFFAHIGRTGDFSMLSSAVSKAAVEEFIEGSDGAPPPGVSVHSVAKVSFRRSK